MDGMEKSPSTVSMNFPCGISVEMVMETKEGVFVSTVSRMKHRGKAGISGAADRRQATSTLVADHRHADY